MTHEGLDRIRCHGLQCSVWCRGRGQRREERESWRELEYTYICIYIERERVSERASSGSYHTCRVALGLNPMVPSAFRPYTPLFMYPQWIHTSGFRAAISVNADRCSVVWCGAV